jgi:hypothetical protein
MILMHVWLCVLLRAWGVVGTRWSLEARIPRSSPHTAPAFDKVGQPPLVPASRRASFARPGRACLVQVERLTSRTTWTRQARSGCLRCAMGCRGADIPERRGTGGGAPAAGGPVRVPLGPEALPAGGEVAQDPAWVIALRCEDQDVAFTNDDASARDGRVWRTAVLGFLAAGLGSNLFDDTADPLLTMPPFVLTMLMTGALIIELTDQARRRQVGGVSRWVGTDTGIVVVLIAYATLLCGAAALQHLPPPEETAAVGFAALYLVLAGSFSWVRHRVLSGPR